LGPKIPFDHLTGVQKVKNCENDGGSDENGILEQML